MPKVIRVSKNEFEMEDGTIHILPFEFDNIPSLEEFQILYDNSKSIIEELLDKNARIINSQPSSKNVGDNNNDT